MRGTPGECGEAVASPGIIPAYAGNTVILSFGLPRRWDHPRVCGEHSERRIAMAPLVGSSPRMRGTLDGLNVRDRPSGIIPAYAGNTASPDSS